MLSGKKILLGVTGSIAAFKIPSLVRLLTKAGAEVRVVMTPAAADFVSPLTLSTLCGAPVDLKLFGAEGWANHVMLGRWADAILIAPLSCNTLAKMATGACDNLLMATYLSATCPVLVAPAMDEDMWHHGTTRRNLGLLATDGCTVIPAEHGSLASGLVGEGRMAEPETLVQWLEKTVSPSMRLHGKKVLITAGPTYEALDPVRYIGNHSSGKMGYALAEAFAAEGAQVVLVSGPSAREPTHKGIERLVVTSAEEMAAACAAHTDYSIAVMSAAVADYTPVEIATEKIKKSGEELTIRLRRTPDILATLGRQKTDAQTLVGFALETTNEESNALHKLSQKSADAIVLNSLRHSGAGFGTDTNRVTLYTKGGERKEFPLASKTEIARQLADAIILLHHA